MFSADKYLIDFVGQNWISLGILIGFLKILATRSESNVDDSIIGYFGEVLSGFRRGKPPENGDASKPPA